MSEIDYERVQFLHDVATECARDGTEIALDADEVILYLTEPLLALRERAEPVYQVQAMDWHDVEKYLYDEALDRGIRCRVLYTAPPATVVPKIDRKAICNKAHWLCARSPGATFYNAAEFALDEVMEMLVTPATVVPDKCGCWYLVSWCYPGGRYGSTEIRLDGPWSTGSMRSAAKMIADYNDLVRANVVILSVFPIAAAPGKN